MKRDFSDVSKQRILGLVNEVERENFSNFTDWIGDGYYTFQTWIGRLNIRNYINNVDLYHKKVIDKNNASKNTILRIFDNVAEVDSMYQKNLLSVKSSLQKWDSYMVQMERIVNPGNAKFSSEYIADSLDGVIRKYKTQESITCFSDLLDIVCKNKKSEEALKTASGVAENIGKYTKNNKVTLSASLLNYFSTLCGVATADISSGKDIFSQIVQLFQSSAGVETGLYKYFEKTLSPYVFSELDGKFGKTMAGLSWISSLAGVVNTAVDTYEVYTNDESSSTEKIAKTIDLSGDLFDFGGKTYITSKAGAKALRFIDSADDSTKAVNQILKTEQTLQYTTSSAVTKKIGKVATAVAIVDVGTSTLSSFVKRAGEVSEDGEIDVSDVGSLGVYSSLGGLESVASGLTLGLVDFDSEQVAEELETEANDFVRSNDWKAQYIRNEENFVGFRFGLSIVSGAELVGKKVINGVGEGINTVGDWISTGWNNLTNWISKK